MEHPSGREAQVDFTHCSGLGVTIGGESFRHLLFHLVLSHSGWSYAEVCFGETFAALVKGLQGALWELGGVPRVVRTDNLSAATHDLRNSRGRAVNARYEAVLTHYGVEATRTNPRSSHENGVVEQGHRRLKNAIAQTLILRGSRDFESEDEYRQSSEESSIGATDWWTRSSRRSGVTCGRFRRLRSRSTPTTVAGCAGGARSGWLTGHTRSHLG